MTNQIAQAFDKIQSEVMNELVIYRPTLSKLTGSITSAILLEKIRHYAHQLKRDFYKFNGACEHEQYRAGDSWQEEIGLTRHEFDGARKRIATRVKKGDNKAELMEVFIGDELAPIERIVLYWRDKNNLIWYRFNEDLYKAHLLKIVNPEIATSEIRHYLVVPKSGITYVVPKSGITFTTEKHKDTIKATAPATPAIKTNPIKDDTDFAQILALVQSALEKKGHMLNSTSLRLLKSDSLDYPLSEWTSAVGVLLERMEKKVIKSPYPYLISILKGQAVELEQEKIVLVKQSNMKQAAMSNSDMMAELEGIG